MKCYVVKDLLPEYIEKLCNEETGKDIEAHIATCKKCQETLKEMSADILQDTKALDIHPFDKIQKKIKREKVKKIILAVCLVVLVAVFGVLSFFQVNPHMGGPSFDTIIYWKKAEDIGRYLANGDIDQILYGVNNSADMLNHINTDLYTYENVFFKDYSEKLQTLYKEAFAGKNYKVKVKSVYYEDRGYYGIKLYGEENSKTGGGYTACLELINGEEVISFNILFYSKNAYIIWEESAENNEKAEDFLNYYNYYAGPVTGVYGEATWAWKVLLRPDRNLSGTTFNLFTNAFTTDSMYKTDDEAYQSKLQEGMKSIYARSTTLTINFDRVKYNEEKQCIDGKLFWELLDQNGKKIVFVKDFYVGPYGFTPVDDTETIFHEDDVDEELIHYLENLF